MRHFIAFLLMLGCISRLAASSYEDLLGRVLKADSSQRRLETAARRAEIAYIQARLQKESPSIRLQSGPLVTAIGQDSAAFTASPSLTLGFSDGLSLGTSASFQSAASGPFSTLAASLGLPLVQKASEKNLSLLAAKAAFEAAEALRLRGGLELELLLDQNLAAVLQSEVNLKTAERQSASAARDLEKAVKVDGAAAGGTSYAALARSLRSANRGLRDSREARRKAGAALLRLVDPDSPSADDSSILPRDFPDRDLLPLTASPEDSYKVAVVWAGLREAERQRAEKSRKTSITPNLGLSYGFGSEQTSSSYSAGSLSPAVAAPGIGLGTTLGLGIDLGDLGISLDSSLSWQKTNGPSLTISLSWAPPPPGSLPLSREDELLARDILALDLQDARLAAFQDRRELEANRQDLETAKREAVEELAVAEADLATMKRALDQGFASGSEYEEARAARDECAARLLAVKLDRIAWGNRAALLTAGAEAFGGTR